MSQPLKMSTDNPQWYRMEAEENADAADVYIYDVIDSWWGVNASQFVKELAALDVSTINLYVNSPGGSVFDGTAIMNAIRRHKAHVVATVDGLAASAASFIIQAADEVVMGFGTELMIHDASAICWGNAKDMEDTASVLNKLSQTIAEVYAERAGGTPEEWREAMLAETWYSAEEAVAAGLADRVEKRKTDEDASNKFDLSVFAHAGRRNAPAPPVPENHERRPGLSLVNGSPLSRVAALVNADTKPPAEPAENTTPNKEGADAMSDELNKGLRERLGISADAELDTAGLLSAVDEALAEQDPPAAPAAQAAPGTVVLDEAQYRELQASAADGREARNQQLAVERESVVNSAIKDGRIPPSRKEHWLNAIATDPAMKETLNGLEKGLIPMEARGYTGGVDESSDEDATYSKLWGSDESKGA